MITRIGFAPAHPSLTVARMRAHWSSTHADLSRKLPHVRRYWQNEAILQDGVPLLPWPGFDVCSEFDFDDPFEMDRAFCSAAYLEHVKPDEDYLLDKPKGGMVLADRILFEGSPADGIRLLTFFRLAPLREPSLLASQLQSLPKAARAHSRELYVALGGRAAGQRISMFAAVEIHWFDSSETALAHVLSEEQRERRYAIADLVRGTENLIARVRKVL